MKIRYLRRALAQLNSIYTFAARDDPDAGAFQNRVQRAIDTLAVNPGLGVRTDEAGIFVFIETTYRYRIFYTPRHEEILILRILFRAPHAHGRIR